MVASALCRWRTSESTTCTSHSFFPSRSFPILANRASSFFNCAGANPTCLPVYVIFMGSPFRPYRPKRPCLCYNSFGTGSVANAPLMGGRNFHVLAVFGNRPPGNIDPLALQQGGDLLVGERLCAVLVLDHLLYLAFQQEQRGGPAGGSLHGLGEEITEFENALW